MRYLVQVFNESRAYCQASRKVDAQEAFERYCRKYPNALVVFSESKKGIIAQRSATSKQVNSTSQN